MKRTLALAFGLALAPVIVHAAPAAPAPAPSARKPVAPAVPYLFKTAASLADLEKTLLGKGSHKSDLVPPGPGQAIEVVWRHEEDVDQAESEIHDGKDHVFFITDGSAVFLLGGDLDKPREISPGEWRSPKLNNTKEIEAKKGDLLFIPHGTAHGRKATGKKFTMLQLSFWPGGAPPAEPKPAAPKK
jgi:mannose-6-phosphate isomerase-like protein (cupin superfamily)